MSSRQEEKQRRREERLAQERAAAASASRRRRLQIVGGAVLGVAAVAAIVVAVGAGGGGKGSKGPGAKELAGISIPRPTVTNLDQAARVAGCSVRSFPLEGRQHITTPGVYRTNPPTSGNHGPNPSPDGVYSPGNPPAKESFVHSLEHGRVELQYRRGTPAKEIKQLQVLFNEALMGHPGYKQLLFANNTNMPYAVAVTAWQHMLACPTFNPKVFDAIRDFRQAYVDKGPEVIPFPE